MGGVGIRLQPKTEGATLSNMASRGQESEAREALADALASLGVEVDRKPPPPRLRVRAGTRWITLEARPETVLSAARGAAVVRELSPSHQRTRHEVVVADEVSRGARALLSEAGIGWLDRRGNARVWIPPLMIDTAVPASPRSASRLRSTGVIRGRAGLAYAVGLLMSPEEPSTLTEIARRAELAVSSVSEAGSVVRDAGLVRADGRPLVPELFAATADAWRPQWRWLAQEPPPGDRKRTDSLGLGLDDLDREGWALSDSRAAVGWGAPLVTSSAYPPALYVPRDRFLRRAVDLYGEGTPSESRGARVAVAPLPDVCRPRYRVPGETWPGTHPLFVALDLAQDPARGGEALERWDPPPAFHRVW